MTEIVTVKATPYKEVYANPDSDFYIYGSNVSLDDMKEKIIELNSWNSISIQSDIPLDLNVVQELEIQYVPEAKYPATYELVSIKYDLPTSPKEQADYLEALVTPNQFNSIYSEYSRTKDYVVTEIIEGTFDYSKVKGIGDVVIQRIKENLEARIDMNELISFLQKYEVSMKLIEKIHKHYGDSKHAIHSIKENPYNLLKVNGIGFIKADAIAMSFDLDPEGEDRIFHGLFYVIIEEVFSNGDTYTSKEFVIKRLASLLDISRKAITNQFTEEKLSQYNMVFDEEGQVTTQAMYDAENYIANAILGHADDKVRELFPENVIDDFIEYFKNDKNIELSDEQIGFLYTVNKSQINFLVGGGGVGKAQPTDMVIPTPSGYKRFGDLKVGDEVFDRLGKPTKVTGVYPKGKLKAFEVTLADGRKTICNDDHLWSYFTSRNNLKTVALSTMIEKGLKKQKSRNNETSTRYKIPTHKAVAYPEKQLPIDPYVIGAFLGDGCLTGKYLEFSSQDEQIVKRIADTMGYTYKKYSNKNYTWVFHKDGIRVQSKDITNQLEEMNGYSYQKRIPDIYMISSIEQRLDLIKGLFDTDGCIVNDQRFSVNYTTTSLGMAHSVKEVLQSLGWTSTILRDQRSDRRTYYSVRPMIDNNDKQNLFFVDRKVEISMSAEKIAKNRLYDRVGIVDIKSLNKEIEMQCIMVDNDEHLYLCNDFIVTHNTFTISVLGELIEYYQNHRRKYTSYSLCAPTGRASKVMTSYVGKEAKTIHRFLGLLNDEDEGKNGSYLANDREPIEDKLIIVDEISMADIPLVYKLMKSVDLNKTKILFIGDDYQIPSVGAGNFLYDCLNCGSAAVNVTKLTKVFRIKEGGVADISGKIRRNEQFLSYGDTGRVKFGSDLVFRMIDDKEEIMENLLSAYKAIIRKGNSSEDIIVLSPKTKNILGVKNINDMIQSEINPLDFDGKEIVVGKDERMTKYRIGDRVLNTVNMYDIPLTNENFDVKHKSEIRRDYFGNETEEEVVESTDVYNGELGTVIAINEDCTKLVVKYDEREVLYKKTDLNTALILGYCMTIHKAQGGQAPFVIAVVDKADTYQLNANLIYTGMTRTQKACLILTQPRTMINSLGKFINKDRKTRLLELLKQDQLIKCK